MRGCSVSLSACHPTSISTSTLPTVQIIRRVTYNNSLRLWLALFKRAEYQNGKLIGAEKGHRQSQLAETPAAQTRETQAGAHPVS